MQTILSVGIDVGTSTTQVVFSRLSMDDAGGFFSVPKVSIVDKEVVYKSDIYLTPLDSEVWINTQALRSIVADEYRRAGVTPADVSSGAVIITGESARKENADAVLKSLSDFAGDFVVSAAGPDMESVIAGKGSGAWEYSQKNHCLAANLDIGGGTTNIVVFDDGEVIARGCFDIGGRLICIDPSMTVTKISPAAMRVAAACGIDLRIGTRTDIRRLKIITERMAQVLASAFGIGGRDILLADLKTPGSSDFVFAGKPAAICFSGGVADMIYHEPADPFAYGDIGGLLGAAIRESRLYKEISVIQPGETIRATVVGAGTYTTTISGSTINYSEDIFPLKNVPVVKLNQAQQAALFEGNPGPAEEKIRWHQAQSDQQRLVLAMTGKKNPAYAEMKRAAAGIVTVLNKTLPEGEPVLLLTEYDIAKALGQMVGRHPDMKRQVVSIDSIKVDDGEYLDMGRPLMDGMVIPVVVKTLIFG